MARDWEEFFDEDECCLECGEPDFAQSKTPGICQACHDDLFTHRNRFDEAEEIARYV